MNNICEPQCKCYMLNDYNCQDNINLHMQLEELKLNTFIMIFNTFVQIIVRLQNTQCNYYHEKKVVG
jgi:hypothetical protein